MRNALVNQIFRAAYMPIDTHGTVVDTIRAIEIANQTALTILAPKIVDPTECACRTKLPQIVENDAFSAIACGDGEERTYDPEVYKAYYADLTSDAPNAGPFSAVHFLQCTEWSVRPKWGYTGPLAAVNTSYPILILQSRFDPVCPLRDALAIRERYGGASLLVQNSYGHCSMSAPSVCTAKHVRAYMEDGRLPEEGTVCEPDELPFVGRVRDARVMSAEDAMSLEALRVVPMFGA
ncbi:TAP-like protein-domain-containing protein [Dichomitus squalens]|uniref:TAP-like protein-domain-containing protein n=1 Tax=Dichomitus squalens TaxID=114155 RepID=A0A4Q9PLP4_9APHY|nr:TAP-like protein-domain-containing protein [Dichomitus squalens]TBU55055.1 TAP-like protein-domain-containing protein [Dichomitus squalens]